MNESNVYDVDVIERLALGRDDVLVVKTKHHVMDEDRKRLSDALRAALGDREILVVGPDIELSIIEATDGLHAKVDRLLALMTADEDDFEEPVTSLDGSRQVRERNQLDPL